MKLKPKGRSREKILLFGWGKVGKSTAILSLAKRNTDDQFYIIDTEGKMDYTIDRNFGDVQLDNVHVTVIGQDDWPGLMKALAEIRAKVKPDDWLVIDSITESWGAVCNFVADKKYGATREDYWEKLFEAKPDTNIGKEGGLDLPWAQVINPSYYKLYGMLKNWPSHVLATAQIDEVDAKSDREGVRQAFGSVGVKPKGQKDLYFQFHEVLLLEKDKNDIHKMSAFGTSSGIHFRDEPFKDWAMDYLMKKAGWHGDTNS